MTANQPLNDEADSLESQLNEDFSDINFTSLPGSPVTLVNIPEARSVTAKFVYNFYVKDERTNGSGQLGVINLSNPSQEEIQRARASKLPRYIQLDIEPAVYTSEDNYLSGFASGFKISENLRLLNFERAVSNSYFSSLRLKDDQLDQSFYDALESSVNFFGVDAQTSGPQLANALTKLGVTGDAAFGPKGLLIRDVLSNMQSQGVRYAPTDTRAEIVPEALRSVRYIDFTMNINNLVISNVVRGSGEDRTNIYQDELFSTYDQADNIQSLSVALQNPSQISADEFELTLNVVDSVAVTSVAVENEGNLNEKSIPVGYYIEKYEIEQQDAEKFRIVTHEPLISDGYTRCSILDTGVKYGSTYIYLVRVVALTRFEAFRRDETGNTPDQVVSVIAAVASAGVNERATCTESIPPNPPRNIKFKWDYDNDCLMIFWDEPHNPQRDVTRYQIFKRLTIDVPFTLTKELDFDKSTSRVVPIEVAPKSKILKVGGPRKFFRDTEFKKDSVYIYTLACQDAHGFTSNYSAQFRVSFDRMKNKIVTELVSRFGAPKPYPNIYLNRDLFVDTMKDSGHSRLRIFFDPEYYDVMKTENVSTYRRGKKHWAKRNASLNLIADNYKLQIINVDDQMSKIVDIQINDLSGPPLDVPINETTINSAGLDNMVSTE